jgi:hypothetical protein
VDNFSKISLKKLSLAVVFPAAGLAVRIFIFREKLANIFKCYNSLSPFLRKNERVFI